MAEIGLVEVSESIEAPSGVRAGFARRPTITLRFLLSASGQRGLDALRDARRSLLREEWTRGREPDEPSLGDAVFSVREIQWEVRPEQRQLCLQKLEELRLRANRMLMEVEPD